jgi:C4-dicarboxylate transporter DctM subunit
MDHLWLGIAALLFFLLLLAGGVYIGVALGLIGLVGTIVLVGFQPALNLLASTAFNFAMTYALIVVPLFVAMGIFASEAAVTQDIYLALSKWLSGIRGGLGLATIGGCTVFGMLTGSSMVTSVVFAKVAVPEMRRHGYDAKMSYGLVCAAGIIGMLIPPNLFAVIYAFLTEQSVTKLLLAGIGPGLVTAVCLGAGLIALISMRPSLGPSTQLSAVTWRDRIVAIPKLWSALVVGVIVIGGIYSGVFTVTEAAGVGTFVLFVLFLLIKRVSRQSFQVLGAAIRETISLTAMVFILVIGAMIFTRFLILSGLAARMTNIIIGMKMSGLAFTIAANVLYLILGMFFDPISIIVMTVPVLHPIANALNLDPIWFGTVLIITANVGGLTPPFALTVYAVKAVAGPDLSLEDVFRGSFPFLMIMVVVIAICIVFPSLSTWIPYHMLE